MSLYSVIGMDLHKSINILFTVLLLLSFTNSAHGSETTTISTSVHPIQSVIEKRHKNVVLQQWELSCAAAALATILRYQHGIPATEHSVALGMISRTEYLSNPEILRIRQGFSLFDLKRYVDNLGYEGLSRAIEPLAHYAGFSEYSKHR